MTVSLCFCDVGGDMQFTSHYIREEDSLQARLSLFTFNRRQTSLRGFSSRLLNRIIPSGVMGGCEAPRQTKHASEDVLGPEHLQITAEVLLSKVQNPQMLTWGPAMK